MLMLKTHPGMTQKIILRPLQASDRKAFALLANNKNIWNNVRNRMPHPYTEEDADEFILMATTIGGPTIRAIILDGTLAGVVGLHPAHDVYEGTAELGYWIGEPFWGRGLASAAVKEIIQIGFKELKLRRIYASVYDYNTASMRVLEKNGFENEGVAKAAVLKNGKVFDEVKYGLLA
jgi:RimJ/RimL family protein N-acetyltransferase